MADDADGKGQAVNGYMGKPSVRPLSLLRKGLPTSSLCIENPSASGRRPWDGVHVDEEEEFLA
jgi:hypothetical protein